jgi:hypothetical protein
LQFLEEFDCCDASLLQAFLPHAEVVQELQDVTWISRGKSKRRAKRPSRNTDTTKDTNAKKTWQVFRPLDRSRLRPPVTHTFTKRPQWSSIHIWQRKRLRKLFLI